MENSSICDGAIEWFERDETKEFHQPGIIANRYGEAVKANYEIKESTDIYSSLENLACVPELAPILNYLWECVMQYTQEFDILYSATSFEISPQINFQKYTPPSGGYKKWHFERNKHDPTFLVWMIYLNDIEKEGGTSFRYLNHTEKAERGKCLIWPAEFTHVHKGEVAPEETKYILTGWYRYK